MQSSVHLSGLERYLNNHPTYKYNIEGSHTKYTLDYPDIK